ncbi:MAG: hypothetical protein ACI399_04170 [Candidatus Cryptobacteroides sp.]
MDIFNPDHDLCLANGNDTFVPPASARRFGQDCNAIMEYVLPDVSPHKVWGWDRIVRGRLLRSGADPLSLPSEDYLDTVRGLSHRRQALLCKEYVFSRLGGASFLCDISPVEINTLGRVVSTVDEYGDCILKAPWSGSGKGIRKVRPDSWTESDRGWCAKVIDRQGSLMVERRQKVALDFSLQFRMTEKELIFEGFAIFETEGCAYNANLLASNGHILGLLSAYSEKKDILRVRDLVGEYLESAFLGRYRGVLGVDMFFTAGGQLAPCIEINVRNNMGMVSRVVYSRLACEYAEVRREPFPDGRLKMRVLNAPEADELQRLLPGSRRILAGGGPSDRHAIAVF